MKMGDEPRNISADAILLWRSKFVVPSCRAEVLREIANTYCVGTTSLAVMLTDLCKGIQLEHVQSVWDWDLRLTGKGISDNELNKQLRELEVRGNNDV
jgi:hypothetical protein